MSLIARFVFLTVLLGVATTAQQPLQSADAKAGDARSSQYLGSIERVSDVQDANCGPYLAKVIQTIRSHWLHVIPADAKAPEMKSAMGAVEFSIMPDGRITGMKIVSSTGDAAMDQAASAAISASEPFAALPPEFHTPSLTLRFKFYYNPRQGSLPDESKKLGS